MPGGHVLTRLPRGLYWAMVAGGVLAAMHWVTRLGTLGIYHDDFVHDYLLARAVLDGQNPYLLSAPRLAAQYLPLSQESVIPYVIPHPPAVALLTLPLGLLPYEVARSLWLGFEVALLCVLVRFLPIGGGRHLLISPVGLPVMLLAWPPVAMDLKHGQWSILLTTLLVLSWLSYRSHRLRLAGSLLGLAIAVKLFPVLMLELFVLKRSWRVVGWAVGVAAVLTAIPALLVGPDLITCYLLAGGQAATAWLASFANYSALGAATRFFASAGDFGGVPSVFPAPALAVPAVAVVAAYLVALTGRAIVESRDSDAAFAVALCAMVLLTPLVWQHYLCLLVWPLWLVGRDLSTAGWPRPRADAFLLAILLLTLPQQAVSLLAIAASDVWSPAGALILLVFPAGPAILLRLLRIMARDSSPQSR